MKNHFHHNNMHFCCSDPIVVSDANENVDIHSHFFEKCIKCYIEIQMLFTPCPLATNSVILFENQLPNGLS